MKTLFGLFAVSILAVSAWRASTPSSMAATALPQSPTAGGWTCGALGLLPDPNFPSGEWQIDLATVGEYRPDLWAVILDYQSFTVGAGATVRFTNNPTRAAVVIRAVSDVVIAGALVLDGEGGHDHDALPVHAEPGPGGFRGGLGKLHAAHVSASAGQGPGGGFIDSNASSFSGGSASHASTASTSVGVSAAPGPRYGSPSFALPLGGSGGAGGAHATFNGGGGGAGGGAILIGSDSAIHLSGTISVRGGAPGESLAVMAGGYGGAGSGGAIRLASPLITQTAGLIDARGGDYQGVIVGGSGWIRIESENVLDPEEIAAFPAEILSNRLGEFLPSDSPSVTLLAWRENVGSPWIDIGQDPEGEIAAGSSPDVELPTGGTKLVRIEGHGVPLGTRLELRVTNTRGQAVIDSSHVVGEVAGSSQRSSWTDVSIDFAPGVHTVQVRAEVP